MRKKISIISRDSSASRRQWAFTLIEVLLIVVIIGVLAAIVIPRVTKKGLYNKYLVYTTAHRVAADLRLARRLAVTTGDEHRLKFFKIGGSGDYNEYRVEQKDGHDWVLVGEAKNIPDEIIVSGDKDVRFKANGSANKNRTFNYELETYRYRVTVRKATGRVKLETY